MPITNKGLEFFGFQDEPELHGLLAHFYRVIVFRLAGLHMTECTLPMHDEIDGYSCSIVVGPTVEAACRSIPGCDFLRCVEPQDNDDARMNAYLALRLGPTSDYEPTSCRARYLDDELCFYDSFGQARAELDRAQEQVVPRILSGVMTALNHYSPVIRCVGQENYGITADGVRIFDLRFGISNNISVSRLVAADTMTESLSSALRRGRSLAPQVASFYDLAHKEADPTKQYLLLFITLELAIGICLL